jgi:PAS domain S-box-containing protein
VPHATPTPQQRSACTDFQVPVERAKKAAPLSLHRLLFPDAPTPASNRYGLAVVASLLVFFLRLSLDPVLLEHSPLVLFMLPVAISAIRGGFGPGIVATLLGSLAGLYFFPPTGSFTIAAEYATTGLIQLAVFISAALIVTWLGSELRALRFRALEFARHRNEILESITDGFEAFDSDYRFEYLNHVSQQMIGKPLSEVIGKTIWDEHPEMRGTIVERKFREVAERRLPVHFEYLSNATGKWFEFHAYPARNGGFAVYLRDISDRKLSELRLRETLAQRDAALEHVRLLSGMVPICAGCKKIRDERGNWEQLESYISSHSEARFSHGMCPECAALYYSETAAALR